MAPTPYEVFANDTATGTLTADPGSGGTTLTGMAAFPTITSGTNVLRVRVDNEIMLVTAHAASATSATVTRGIEGTTAAAHSVGATVNAVFTAEGQRRHIPPYAWHPRMNNVLAAQPWPPTSYSNNTSSAPLTAGTVYYQKAYVPEDITATGITVGLSGGGATLANTFVGLINSAGTRTAVSADASTTFQTAGLRRDVAFTGALGITGGPGVWVLMAFVFGSGGTAPAFRSTPGAGQNLWLTSADVYWSFSKETAQTAIPTTTDPTTGTNSTVALAMALY